MNDEEQPVELQHGPAIVNGRRSRRFAFTFFPEQPRGEDDGGLARLREGRDQCIGRLIEHGASYVIIGIERCGTTERLHYQGYVEFTNARSWKSVVKIIGVGSHVEPAHQQPEVNRSYCAKDNEFKEEGVMSVGRGRRSDLVGIKVIYFYRFH